MSDVWWPEGTNDPAFQVQRQPYGIIEGGDYVRARSGQALLPQTALRYATQVKGWDDILGKALVAIRPHSYNTLAITWGWPKVMGDKWTEVALVRSSFGRPNTPNDGVTVFRETRDRLLIDYSADGVNILAPLVYDGVGPQESIMTGRPLRSGRWYYYTVFFKTGPLDWVPGMSMGSPLPRNYGHAEHLWNHTPPWYQYQDGQMRESDGYLQQFYRVFGFELDYTREYVEQWQHLYHIDFAPRRLLMHLGYNFDVPYEPGLGDVRYRGLVGSVARLYDERGTRKGLVNLVQAASQFPCDITRGGNLMLIPVDSEFLGGSGNWSAPPTTLTPPTGWGSLNTYEKTVIRPTTDVGPPTGGGRGAVEVFVTEIAH